MDKKKLAHAQSLVGGRFKLCVLLQKRVHELVKGAPKLVDQNSRNLIDIALEEVIQNKIALAHEEYVPEEAPETEAVSGRDDDEPQFERRPQAQDHRAAALAATNS